MSTSRCLKTAQNKTRRLRVRIRGAVQGVGFRPFIYRLASELRLPGWVNNSVEGVTIEVEGSEAVLRRFSQRIGNEKPPRSFIQSLESAYFDTVGFEEFSIRESLAEGTKSAVVLPDIATCLECLEEVFDSKNRRFLYPFTNCTNCGPRYSIIESLPYDRPNTTMRKFEMCADCRAEYYNPEDRRFHAQPNACPNCGPRLELWNRSGAAMASGFDALSKAADAIRNGQIVAVKGLGGFHLIVDAANDGTVRELRRRKHREQKPFALMFPSAESVEAFCEVSEIEMRLLESPERPIVILRAKGAAGISPLAAPGNPNLGCMLPYTPLHHLLMRELGFPVIATSGNLSDEPICTDENEALNRLGTIADVFLVHDRPIFRPVDDSIVRVMAGREMTVRRARGFAPLPIRLKTSSRPTLAVGAHLKNSVAAAAGDQVFVSQHIGDLETPQAFAAFSEVIESLEALYELRPEVVVCDKHPDYLSTRFAVQSSMPRIGVQHHYAHVLSCMAENELEPPVFGIAWDGTGFGDDGTIWGGEFLKVGPSGYERFAHLRQFRLPGGDHAAHEPRRGAIGALYELFGPESFDLAELPPMQAFEDTERLILKNMLTNGVNAPLTSSVGRLFDAAASLAGICQIAGFEGQAAMQLEFAIGDTATEEHYDFEIRRPQNSPIIIDWARAFREMILDIKNGVDRCLIAARFHNMLAEAAVRAGELAGIESAALSGGCFQNKYLLERVVKRLRKKGFRPYWHQRVPTNDGGIALGQIRAAEMHRAAPESAGRANSDRRIAICV